MDYTKHVSVEKLADSEVRLTGSLPYELIAPYQKKAFKEIQKNFELPGFRAGKVPEHMLKTHFSDVTILHEGVEIFFKDQYEEMVKQLKVFPIDRPQITLKKVAPQNPVEFEITVAVIPDISLPDYARIIPTVTLETDQPVANEEELKKTIEELARMSGGDSFNEKEFSVDAINTEFIKKFGTFESVDDFKSKLKESIVKDKERQQKEKNRLAILEALVKEFPVELPKIFIESELDRMIRELHADIARHRISPKEYFERIKKTEEALRAEWRPQAIERVKIEMLLSEIAKKESIAPEQQSIDAEVHHILSHDSSLEKERVHSYVEHMMTNNATLDYLENLSKKK